jgi:transposase InsO family protein
MKQICGIFGYTRQGYYKHLKIQSERAIRDEEVLKVVKLIRLRQAKIGGKKLHKMIQPDIKIGRDYLFSLLQSQGLLVKTKRKFTKTTISGSLKVKHPNLIKHAELTHTNQAWVVDITFINTCNGFVYLYLVTDLYSRKIIAHHVADNLHAKTACIALKAALTTTKTPKDIIHHSDQGIQYMSKQYQDILQSNSMLCSTTGKDHCYDNAVAERVNGILKHEFGLSQTMPSLKVAREMADEAVSIYNNERIHASLGYQTPASMYINGLQDYPHGGHSIYVGDGVAKCKKCHATTIPEEKHV